MAEGRRPVFGSYFLLGRGGVFRQGEGHGSEGLYGFWVWSFCKLPAVPQVGGSWSYQDHLIGPLMGEDLHPVHQEIRKSWRPLKMQGPVRISKRIIHKGPVGGYWWGAIEGQERPRRPMPRGSGLSAVSVASLCACLLHL